MTTTSTQTPVVVDPNVPTLFGIPLNRLVAFFGPYISLIAGAAAAWLIAKVNIAGIPGLDQANIATWIAAALTQTLVTVLTWLGQSKWLHGHHIELAAAGQAAVMEASRDTTYVKADGDPAEQATVSTVAEVDEPSNA